VIGDYRGIKKQGEQQEIWMEQMIQAQAEAQNMTKSKLWKKVKCTEQSHNMARWVKTALGK